MSGKFHINKHGVPAPCKAKEGNCPLGGSDTHYDTPEEAQVAADKANEAKHGLLPGVENHSYEMTPEQKVQFDNKVDEFADKASQASFQHDDCSPETSDYSLDTVVENYFDAVIDKHSGFDVDLAKYEHDWEEELDDNMDAYEYDEDPYDYEWGGGQRAGWTEESQEDFDYDMRKAEENNANFEDYKDFIHNAVKEVQQIDWTQYGISQKDGEIEALTRLRDSDKW